MLENIVDAWTVIISKQVLNKLYQHGPSNLNVYQYGSPRSFGLQHVLFLSYLQTNLDLPNVLVFGVIL